ncbi:hypothetical protein [Agromyces sp. LHK192]|uniref:hypothetical protein n=1 Tax=Agromyces sp. LHK192 TaxID=2498704 RepID=UPI000FD8E198|nr:hypothetical protein [Agromyces sp. LHK192]
MIDALQGFAASFPDWLQWLGVMIVSAIPFVEVEAGSVIGVLIGLPVVVAVGVAVIGNFLSMLIVVLVADRTRRTAIEMRRRKRALVGAGAPGASVRGAGAGAADVDEASVTTAGPGESPRREKLRRSFDRYGIAGVSLLGPTILPTQITSAAMISFGANRNLVILWQTIAIILWGVVFGVLASLGLSIATH